MSLAEPPVPHHWVGAPVDRSLERAIVAVWRDLNPDTARAYVASLLPTIRQARAIERFPERTLPRPGLLEEPERYGPVWIADRVLGQGGDGTALHARHRLTGEEVVIKVPARGDGWVWQHLGDDWHPSLVRVLDGERETSTSIRMHWIAREYSGQGTLAEELHRRGGRLPVAEALEVFRVCCEAVAWFHTRHVYRWSAHVKNILRFGDTWRIADYGRSVIFVSPDHWANEAQKAYGDPEPLWGHPTSSGFWPYNPERERRLRLDDCAMLSGLLTILLSGARWRHFYRALRPPYCTAIYMGNEALSRVLNRCWLGDAGGALAVAAGQDWDAGYDDVMVLLADVEDALAVTTIRSTKWCAA